MSGDKDYTLEQAREVLRIKSLMEAEGVRVCIHWNKCGCCISVHEDTERPTWGYIVGSDGGSDRLEL